MPCPISSRSQRAVLIGQRDHGALRGHPRRAAGVGEQQEGEQAGDLRIVGQQTVQHPRQIEGAFGEIAADEVVARRCGVPGGEQQMHHRQHGLDALGQFRRARHSVGYPGGGDLLLGAGDPRGHRRLGHQEGARDLGRGESADQTQGQCDLGLAGQSRMTAGADQSQTVVGKLWVVRVDRIENGCLDGLFVCDQQRQRPARGGLPAQQIQGVVARHRGQPGRGPRRNSVRGPSHQRLGVRVLNAFLGEFEVMGHPHGRRQHERPLPAMRVGHRGGDPAGRAAIGGAIVDGAAVEHGAAQLNSRIGRTSTPPNSIGTRRAMAIAASRSSASTR